MSRLQFRDIQAFARHTLPHRCGAIRRIDYTKVREIFHSVSKLPEFTRQTRGWPKAVTFVG
jgi:hypothetical protein